MSATPANLNHWPVTNESQDTPPSASLAMAPGDLMYYDAATDTVKPFSAKTTLASEVLDQAAIAQLFVGVSNTQRRSDDTGVATAPRIISDEIWEFPCVSGTFEAGDLVGPSWNGGAALADQVVAKVSLPFLAIGVVQKPYTAATTKVKVRLTSRFVIPGNKAREGFGCFQGTGSAAGADADTTLTVASAPIQIIVPTAARNYTLPAAAQSAGLQFVFVNNSAGAFAVTVKDAAAATIATVAQNKRAVVWCDGTNWYGGAFA